MRIIPRDVERGLLGGCVANAEDTQRTGRYRRRPSVQRSAGSETRAERGTACKFVMLGIGIRG